VLTDQAAGLPILERNAELNAEALRAASCQPPTVHKLTWLDYITATSRIFTTNMWVLIKEREQGR
jgi:hypothetical protein